MRIVVAMDKFRGSLNARLACSSVAGALRAAIPSAEVLEFPMADGGEGTLEALSPRFPNIKHLTVSGPLGNEVSASIAYGDGVAIIESSQACGLLLVPPDLRNPATAMSHGVGQLISEASKLGSRQVLVGVGGTASCDGGAGLAEELGVRFLDRKGSFVKPMGGTLSLIRHIEPPTEPILPKDTNVHALCDASSSLYGSQGSAFLYAPHKGADGDQVKRLDAGLRHLATVAATSGFPNRPNFEGSGSGGGIPFGIMTFLGGTASSGAEFVSRDLGLAAVVSEADVVITGEGSFDCETLNGKAPHVVWKVANSFGVPTIVLAGQSSVPLERVRKEGVIAIHALQKLEPDTQVCIRDAQSLLTRLAGESLRETLESVPGFK